jgi:hypothetical protein
MGYVSQRSRGYSDGFCDSFLGNARRYRLQRFVSLVSVIGSRPSTPEREYTAGYETGREHGIAARIQFVEFTGEPPSDISDWEWRNREARARLTLAEFNGGTGEPDIAAYSETYLRLKGYLGVGRMLRALNEAMTFFKAVKNVDAFWGCERLLERWRANAAAARGSKAPRDEAKAEWRNIAQAAAELIEEIKPADGIGSIAPESTSRPQTDETHAYSSAAEFVTFKTQEIRHVIVEKWRIAQTTLPGEYAATVDRIAKWFDNFATTEYDDALMLLRGVRVLSLGDVDGLLETIVQELSRLFSGNLKNVVFCGLGNSGGSSGGQFLYSLRQKLSLPEGHFPLEYHRLRRGVDSIVFVDDIIGSGEQAQRFFDQHLRGVTATKYYCSLVAFRSGLETLREGSRFKFVFAAKVLEESERAFSAGSRIFPDDATRLRVMEMAYRYGRALYPKGPLGYDDGQAMIVFPHNTPNNTLPIIWASARNEKTVGVPWSPLWERRKSTKPSLE